MRSGRPGPFCVSDEKALACWTKQKRTIMQMSHGSTGPTGWGLDTRPQAMTSRRQFPSPLIQSSPIQRWNTPHEINVIFNRLRRRVNWRSSATRGASLNLIKSIMQRARRGFRCVIDGWIFFTTTSYSSTGNYSNDFIRRSNRPVIRISDAAGRWV